MIRSLIIIFSSVCLWFTISWLLFHSISITLTNEVSGTEIFRACFLPGMVSNAIIFFGVLYAFPLEDGRWSSAFLKQLLVLWAGVTMLELMVDTWLLNRSHLHLDSLMWFEVRLGTLVSNLVVMALGLFVCLAMDWFHQHQLAREISRQQARTELDLLKSRINPHFLFNTLNGIFYTAQKNGDQETADAIAKLSQMMRYMLEDVSREQVSLEGELEYLENYVSMQRMRLADHIPIEFTIEGRIRGITLPPMLLLPFIENAFKHGVSNANPTPIIMGIRLEGNHLQLNVDNTIHAAANPESGGFGLDNVRRRLELLFPERHRLNAGEDQGHYRVCLDLWLNDHQGETKEHGTMFLKERDV